MNTKPITTSYYPTIKVNKQQQQPIHIYTTRHNSKINYNP